MVAQWPVIGGARSVGMNAGRLSETSRSKALPVTTLVVGTEAIGRKLQIREEYGHGWVSGRLTDFNAETNEHRFLADAGTEEDDSDGGEDIENGGIGEWVCLGKRLFRWVTTPAPGDDPNPTYKDFPGDHAAIGWKVRVYWNEMGRWYIGHVRSFDHRSGMHEVRFCDGDVRFYLIKNEPVLWLERPQNRKRARKDGKGDKSRKSSRPNAKANGTGRKSRSTTSLLNVDGDSDAAASQEEDSASNAKRKQGKDSKRSERDDCGKLCRERGESSSRANAAAGARNDNGGARGRGDSDKGIENGVKHEGDPDSTTWQLRPRKGMPFTGAFRNPKLSVVKARVGIFWEGDDRYYRGTISAYNEITDKYTICYDDNTKEELDLKEEKFQWYGPRGGSGAYSSAMRDTMAELGYKGLPKQGSIPTPSPPSEELRPAEPNSLIGKRVFVYWAANGQYYEGEVLAYCKRKKTHFIWYKDGEVEWLELNKEHVIWGDLVRGCTFPAGLGEGEWQIQLKPTPQYTWGIADEDPPRGRAAMGWRVAVFWKDDATFYEGTVTGYNNATGRHDVLYDDHEIENLSLSSEKVIWRLPPNVGREARKAGRMKGSILKSRKSVSDRTEKEEEGTPSIQNDTPATNPSAPSSLPTQKVKGARARIRGRGRRNGNRNVQSSSRPTSRRRRSIPEGDSEVVGPSRSPNEAASLQSPKSEMIDDGEEDGHMTPKSPEIESSIEEQTGRKSRIVSGGNSDNMNPINSRSPMGALDGAGRLGINGYHGNHQTWKRSESAQRGEDKKVLLDEKMEYSESGSPRSQSPMSLDGELTNALGEEVLQPDSLEGVSWDKLPSVDVTRLVRLPPEFGSLEVKLRITAGNMDASKASMSPKADQGIPEEPTARDSNPESVQDEVAARHSMLENRVGAIEQMLSAISRYEQAHQTVGHVASLCDQVAMAGVLPEEPSKETTSKNLITHPPGMDGTAQTAFNFTSRGSLPVHATRPPSKRAGMNRQKSLPNNMSGMISKMKLTGAPSPLALNDSMGSPMLQPPSAPPIGKALAPQASQSTLVTQISPRATSQFGVSSVPAIVSTYGKQPTSSTGFCLTTDSKEGDGIGNNLKKPARKDGEKMDRISTSPFEKPDDCTGSFVSLDRTDSATGRELLKRGTVGTVKAGVGDLGDLDGEPKKVPVKHIGEPLPNK